MHRLHVLLFAAIALAFAAPLPGAESVAATGNYSIMAVKVLSVQPLPNGCAIEMNVTFGFTGTFTGALNTNVTLMNKGPCGQPAVQELHGVGMFVGTVAGEPGGVDVEFRGRHDEQRVADGTIVVLAGDSDLAGLRGFFRLTGIAGIGGVYDGQIQIDR